MREYINRDCGQPGAYAKACPHLMKVYMGFPEIQKLLLQCTQPEFEWSEKSKDGEYSYYFTTADTPTVQRAILTMKDYCVTLTCGIIHMEGAKKDRRVDWMIRLMFMSYVGMGKLNFGPDNLYKIQITPMQGEEYLDDIEKEDRVIKEAEEKKSLKDAV